MNHDAGSAPTMHDVAARAGVALSSVSRVLSGHPDVSTKMKTQVIAAADELGYEPDYLAQSLRRGSTMTVGFTVRDISNPLFAEMVKGAETSLRPSGYSMLLTNSDGDPELELSHLSLFRRRRVDGLILSLASEVHGPTIDLLGAFGRPMVLVDRDVPSLAAGAVLCDHYPGALAAVSDLLARGRTRIAFVAGDEGLRATRERLRGYVDAHRELGVDVDPELIFQGAYTEDYGRAAAQDALVLDERPSAFFAGGIQLAIGALAALNEHRLVVGKDVGFVACDALPIMRVLEPGLSVVTRDSLEMGQVAAHELLRQMAGEAPSVSTVSTRFLA